MQNVYRAVTGQQGEKWSLSLSWGVLLSDETFQEGGIAPAAQRTEGVLPAAG